MEKTEKKKTEAKELPATKLVRTYEVAGAIYNNYDSDEIALYEVYLSKIKFLDTSTRTQQFSLSEASRLAGGRIRKDNLESTLFGLLTKVATFDKEDGTKTMVSLFERASFNLEEVDPIITLTCSQSAMDYIFKQEAKRFLRGEVMLKRIGSIIAWKLYNYLQVHKYGATHFTKGVIEVSLQELKTVLLSDDEAEYYKESWRFREKALKRASERVNETVPSLKHEFEPVPDEHDSRKISKIRFTFIDKTIPKELEDKQVADQQGEEAPKKPAEKHRTVPLRPLIKNGG